MTVIEHPDAVRVGKRIVVRPDGGRTAPWARAAADDAAVDDARGLLAAGRNAVAHVRPGRTAPWTRACAVFVASYAPKPRMLVFGAIDFAAAVARIGVVPRLPGHGVRRAADLRHPARFPDADEVVVDWPHRYLASQVEAGRRRRAYGHLRPDPRPEVRRPAARGGATAARRSAYVGAMGSRRTHDDRIARLREAGLTDEELGRSVQPDRPRPRGSDAGGDRRVHRRGDHRLAVGRQG
ncbi:MAG: XdhC family protein [Nocardioidaceae bacterium]